MSSSVSFASGTFALHKDSTGSPYMLLSMREWIDSRARLLANDPEARKLPCSDLYQLHVRDVAKTHGYDWDKAQRESLMVEEQRAPEPPPEPDMGMEKA